MSIANFRLTVSPGVVVTVNLHECDVIIAITQVVRDRRSAIGRLLRQIFALEEVPISEVFIIYINHCFVYHEV